MEKYQELKQDMIKMWNLKKVEVVLVVVGALGAVTNNFEKWIKKLGIRTCTKTALLGTARILRKHMNTEN